MSSAKTTVYLTGGGPGAFGAVKRHFRAAARTLETKAPLVAYVGSASSDDPGFFRRIGRALESSGARVRMAKSATARAPASASRQLLHDCDLVFVSGGDVDHGIRVLRDRGLDRTLRALARAGKPMFGLSAGSIMLAREWVRFPDDDDTRAEIFPCLGIAPVHVDAHAEDDDWAELRMLVRLLHARGDRSPVGHGLTKTGGLAIVASGTTAKLRAMGTNIPRVGIVRGKVVDRAPLKPKP